MFAEGGDDPMHSDLLGDGEFWDAWTSFYLREPGDGVLLGTRPRDEFLKLLSTRFNVDASVPCTCKAYIPTPQTPDNIVLLRFEKGVTMRIQSVMPRSSAIHLCHSWLKDPALNYGSAVSTARHASNVGDVDSDRAPDSHRSSIKTNRWKPTDSTLRTLSTEMGMDYPESSDSGDEVLSL
jgi:hypothetical protein